MVSAAERIKEDSDIIRSFKKGQREFHDIVMIPEKGKTTSIFEGVDLRGIKMIDCTMINSDFRNANLEDSDFSGSDLADSNFSGANLARANFSDCNLFNAIMIGAITDGTNFTNADFSSAQIGDLSNAITNGAKFKSDKVRMTDQEILQRYREGERTFVDVNASNNDFADAALRGAVFKNCNLHYTWFRGADLTDAQFISCDLTDCGFQKATIRNTSFEKSNLFWSSFSGAFIEKASFRGANMTWMVLTGVDLSSSDLTGADFSWSLMTDTEVSERQMMAMDPDMISTAKMDKVKEKESFSGRLGGTYAGRVGGGTYGANFSEGSYGSSAGEGAVYGGRKKGDSDEVAYG
ncbi:MAG TPA: pentapeptide repeat-containing protein [archaeon]|nr:pentapeptide repeat-containing protein [archaeon]